jgi:molecular chaperone DnaK (HSP70)
MVQHFIKAPDKDCSKNPRALALVTKECENAKGFFSGRVNSIPITVPLLFDGSDFLTFLTKPEFIAIIGPIIEKITPAIEAAIKESKLKQEMIDPVFLTGRTSQIPAMQNAVSAFFEGRRKPIFVSNPQQDVACAVSMLVEMKLKILESLGLINAPKKNAMKTEEQPELSFRPPIR